MQLPVIISVSHFWQIDTFFLFFSLSLFMLVDQLIEHNGYTKEADETELFVFRKL